MAPEDWKPVITCNRKQEAMLLQVPAEPAQNQVKGVGAWGIQKDALTPQPDSASTTPFLLPPKSPCFFFFYILPKFHWELPWVSEFRTAQSVSPQSTPVRQPCQERCVVAASSVTRQELGCAALRLAGTGLVGTKGSSAVGLASALWG